MPHWPTYILTEIGEAGGIIQQAKNSKFLSTLHECFA